MSSKEQVGKLEEQEAKRKEKLWTKDFVLLGLSCLFLFLAFEMLLPALPLYVAQIGGSTSEIGIVMGCFTLTAVLIRPVSGYAADTYGKKLLLIIGGVLCLVATGFYYAAISVTGLLIIRLLHGFGFGIATTLYGTMASDMVPPSRMGEGMGYFGLANTIAISIGPFFGVIIMESLGYQTLIMVSGSILSLACIFNLIVKATAHRPASRMPDIAEADSAFTAIAHGAVVIEPAIEHSSEPIQVRELDSKAPEQAMLSSQLKDKTAISWSSRLVERKALFPSLLGMMAGFGFGGILSFITLFGKEVGIANIGYFFLVVSLFEVLVRLVSGRIFDTKGPFWVIFPSAILTCIATIILSYAGSMVTMLVAAAFFGLGFGAMFPALQAWVITRVDPESRGSATATFYNLFDIGIASGAILLGIIAGMTGYGMMFRLSSLTYVVLIAMYMVYEFRAQKAS
ncbi:MFS transporter [Paenibacillus agricola]|uniref:MFS transporter n=1 Tax=Paenibacillus agricola TaxID=2716264 RepID=A0ABX0J905_9BACL|nr:MFS transporter [Paenibacillus agricola]NHN31801.1 MFS transporter [Paenibacillus agricola]